MPGQLVEFPRKLEWQHVDCWYGRVAGTQLTAKVEGKLDGEEGYNWAVWNGPLIVAANSARDFEAAQAAAKEALEKGVVVVRPLPAG